MEIRLQLDQAPQQLLVGAFKLRPFLLPINSSYKSHYSLKTKLKKFLMIS